MPKRVLIVAGRMHYGGLENLIMNLIRNIDKDKITFDFMLNYEKSGVFDKEILSLGSKIFIMPRLKIKNLFRYVKAVRQCFKENKGKYDIVHGHLTSVGIIYLIIAKIYGVKTRIIHAHYTQTQNTLKGKLERLMILPLRFSADFYFACSNKAGQYCYGKSKLKKENYKLIKNGIVVEKFLYNKKTREAKRLELDIKDEFVITHIGRFEKEKNHKFLIEVFKRAYKEDKNILLMLVGNGSLMSEIQDLIKDSNFSNAVLFLNNRNDINELLQASDLFILPSLYEGLPIVSIEAQAAGLKCIFADTITKEADISGNCKFLSLNTNPLIWANEILSNKIYDRCKMEEKIKIAGYDIKEQALWLQNFYLNH